jgi:hypothetical protein
MAKIAKIILFVEDSFFFGIKNSPRDPNKDKKLELLGGGVDKGETALQALIRELAEEEQSGLVADKVAALGLAPTEIKIEGTPHVMYHMEITATELENMRMNTSEHHGWRLIPRSTITTPERLDLAVFTRRTVKIFDELKRLKHFPYGGS